MPGQSLEACMNLRHLNHIHQGANNESVPWRPVYRPAMTAQALPYHQEARYRDPTGFRDSPYWRTRRALDGRIT